MIPTCRPSTKPFMQCTRELSVYALFRKIGPLSSDSARTDVSTVGQWFGVRPGFFAEGDGTLFARCRDVPDQSTQNHQTSPPPMPTFSSLLTWRFPRATAVNAAASRNEICLPRLTVPKRLCWNLSKRGQQSRRQYKRSQAGFQCCRWLARRPRASDDPATRARPPHCFSTLSSAPSSSSSSRLHPLDLAQLSVRTDPREA